MGLFYVEIEGLSSLELMFDQRVDKLLNLQRKKNYNKAVKNYPKDSIGIWRNKVLGGRDCNKKHILDHRTKLRYV